jgi:hypothetical protein
MLYVVIVSAKDFFWLQSQPEIRRQELHCIRHNFVKSVRIASGYASADDGHTKEVIDCVVLEQKSDRYYKSFST